MRATAASSAPALRIKLTDVWRQVSKASQRSLCGAVKTRWAPAKRAGKPGSIAIVRQPGSSCNTRTRSSQLAPSGK
ncbi:hypothetical protein D3C72_1047090 [compost metagenome]